MTSGISPLTSVKASLFSLNAEELTTNIDQALSDGDAELARSLYEIGVDRDLQFEPNVERRIEAAEVFSITKTAGELWSGLYSGSAKSPAEFVGSLAADLSVVGDARDLYSEVMKYPNYDEFSVGLSSLGIIATGATITSGASGATAKAGISLIKAAKRTGRLSPALQREIRTSLANVLDINAARQLAKNLGDFDFLQAVESTKKIVHAERLVELADVSQSVGVIAYKQGYRGTLDTFRAAQSATDFKKAEMVSEAYGSRFRAAMHFAGRAGKLTMGVVEFITALGAHLAFLFLWLVVFALYGLKSAFRLTRWALAPPPRCHTRP